MMHLRIGTRESKLSLTQVEIFIRQLKKLPQKISYEVIPMSTSGDRILDRHLAEVGGKGLFLKELEDAMLRGEIDLAVHSMKDVPGFLPEGLKLACVLEREDARDVFISHTGRALGDLPEDVIIGSSSPRRVALLSKLKPHAQIELLRGNVQTRLNKVKNRTVDATILAAAGLRRLNLMHEATQVFSVNEMIPAVGQGAIAIEIREDAAEIASLMEQINHQVSWLCVDTERIFLQTISGDCTTPLAAYAQLQGNKIHLDAMLASEEDHSKIIKIARTFDIVDRESETKRAAEYCLNAVHS
jgi:hydroxymethylbilane synthase